MKARMLTKAEWPTLLDWWEAWTKTRPGLEFFSDHGLVCVKDDALIAAIFLYPIMGCKFAFIGWPVANPKYSQEERDVALDIVLIAAEDSARKLGYNLTMTYASRSSVKNRFEKHGYVIGDQMCTNMLKKIEGVSHGI